VRAEHADRLAGLDEQGLVGLQVAEGGDDRVERLPAARGAAGAAVLVTAGLVSSGAGLGAGAALAAGLAAGLTGAETTGVLAFGCSFNGLAGFGVALTAAGLATGLTTGLAGCGFGDFFVAIGPPRFISGI